MKILIRGGYLVDPANKIDGVCDILTQDGKIASVTQNIKPDADRIIDAKGLIVMPGIVDMHVHLREPGREDKETVASGTQAALRGGVTSVLAMPNTSPAIDCVDNVKLLKGIIEKTACTDVFIAAAITVGRKGAELTDIVKLKKEGVAALSDDGASVDSDSLMCDALIQAKKEDLLIICHCEDRALSQKGVVNLGFVSTRLGLRGISRESEYKRVVRDIMLAQKTGARLHIAHVSCRESVELIAKAKKEGLSVTCETAPHYFSLSEEAVLGYDTNMKINPPLRTKEDVAAIKAGLKDGTIDVIASDHAPHTESDKEIEFDRAEFGTTGLETELAVSVTELVAAGILDWRALAEKLCFNPAKILGIPKGTLGQGCDADITVVSPDARWVVRKEEFASKSKNSAFLGREFSGAVAYTICGGKIVYKNPGSD